MSALRVSVPGQPPRLVPDVDPWATLTPWQRRVAEAVLARRGSRTLAAEDLGVNVDSVFWAMRAIRRAGLRLPDGPHRGPDRQPRKGTRPPCESPLRFGGSCARGRGHGGGHRSPQVVERQRAMDARRRSRASS